ncbi:Piso0_000424 [Millerozyma farinosa CBS 7064]|uniref:DNA repair protein RAD50 n=1 Tax=Pichia sorbitophila (strain ATCC MYA-4447 / BCRC 22081 / CBS 7064 / NBRC 10061 / NRRL Y-12695) TaxID=559304 RepID=G8YVE5_PICSO|nr:Piso0_000424 [Millerozyma farinosa CBS 7064]CCE73389.1 Piso0_000424 [Millerozyma farinosa CBS 7064]
MSSLYKLSIQGIRSFDPERQEAIQFGFPLTLICGQNGCGKTTIIECLKYATTGDLPPNAKGGAFINDPSIASRSSVTAQVKLAFVNANGKSMILTKTMQLTKKRTRTGTSSNTFKTLDGQLAVMDKGNKTTMSTKNSELYSSVPMYLGVSRAILDYVIFCHQDDSLWPLSEASVLKKRFDDIFEASKFTKVLDNLKTIRKDMTTDIKLIDQSVQHLKIDKNRAKKINEKVTSLNDLVEKYSSEIAELTVQIEKRESEAESLFQANQEFQETLAKYEQLNFTLKSYKDQIERLTSTIKISSEPDDVILEELNNFETNVENANRNIEDLTKSRNTQIQELSNLRNEQNSFIRNEGSLRSKESEFHKNKEKLASLALDFSKLHQIDSMEINDDEKRVNNVMKRMQDEVEKLDEAYNEMTTNNSEQLEVKEALYQDTKSSISREEQNLQYCQSEQNKIINKLANLRKSTEESRGLDNKLELEKTEIEQLSLKLDEKRSQLDLVALQRSIDDLSSSVNHLEFECEELSRKIVSSNKSSDIHARISLISEEIDVKKKTLNNIISNQRDLFESVTNQLFDISNCEKIIKDLSSLKQKMSDELRDSLSSIERKKNSLETLLKSKEELLNAKKLQTANQLKTISNELSKEEISSFEKILEEVQENYHITQEALNTFEVSKQFKIKAIGVAESSNNCALCLRDFDSPGLKKFLDFLKADVKKMDVKELEDNLNTSKKELDSIRSVHSNVIEYRKLNDECEALSQEIEMLKTQISDQDNALRSKVDLKEPLNRDIGNLDTLRKNVSDLISLNDDIISKTKGLTELRDQLMVYGTSDQSLDDLQKAQTEKNDKIKDLRRQLSERVDLKYSAQRDISRLENEMKDKRLSISNIEKLLMNNTNIKTSIRDCEENLEELKQREKKHHEVLGKLKSSFLEKEKDMKEYRNRVKQIETEASEKLHETKSLLENFTLIRQNIDQYIKHDSAQLETITKKLKASEERISELEKDIKKLELEIKEKEKVLSESSNIKSELRDNLELRNSQREIESIQVQIEELNISDAQEKKEDYHKKSRNIRDLLTQLNADHAGKVGEIRQMKDQIRSLRSELMHEYKDVDSRFHEEWIKLQTNMLVSNDIQTYSRALDNAIMKYHGMKMEEINRILAELWSQTYRGTDIDSIAIKSDVSVQSKGNRSYNYRVVMYRQSTELDMRGRCSAGQKVLTSILIRLALAECFGTNCGVIALDEPTTNLDQENAESLAQALNKIIEFRKNQRNFQLIVITHDEKFLSHINGDRFTDHFYRVQRDELQKSVIRSLPIRLISYD